MELHAKPAGAGRNFKLWRENGERVSFEVVKSTWSPNMALNNTGDTIDLLDDDGQVVDSVTYGVVAEGEFVISN